MVFLFFLPKTNPNFLFFPPLFFPKKNQTFIKKPPSLFFYKNPFWRGKKTLGFFFLYILDRHRAFKTFFFSFSPTLDFFIYYNFFRKKWAGGEIPVVFEILAQFFFTKRKNFLRKGFLFFSQTPIFGGDGAHFANGGFFFL